MVKIMSKVFKQKLTSIVSLILLFTVNIYTQMPPVRVPQQEQPVEDNTWWYITLFVLVLGLLGAIAWLVKSKKSEKAEADQISDGDWDPNSVDADAELEWFRKHSKSSGNKKGKKLPKGMPRTSKVLNKQKGKVKEAGTVTKSFDETKKKVEKMQFLKLPIHSFIELQPAKHYQELPLSNDPALISAIEQTHDEFEEDEEVRDLAVRVLAAFKNKNAVEALADVALYDLSASLRSKAVSVLSEFNHESVFESLLLACADPTREVRAAAARALFSLDFDRADSWTRIIESGDQYRMVQAARAAIEGGLVDRSIDRLVHQDRKYAYEAFTLISLLIKSGETKEIFESIENHRDKFVKMAVLHVFKVVKDEKTLPGLYAYIERNSLPEDLSNAANEVIKSFDAVPA